MKKLDKLILKSFIGPFAVTFFIVLFILLMQFFWLYMDDLIGKGLPITLLLELMMFWSATLVPLAMPLGILLASIMTFGNLGESYELVAIKSSGISLFRFMRPLTILVTSIVIGMFYFSNYVIPYANLKAFSLLYDITNQKPTMSIRPGIFNREIGKFAIRIGSKSKDKVSIQDVLIYDHTNTLANNNVIIAKDGKMFLSKDKRFLVFELNDGWRYDLKQDDSGTYEQQRMYFKHWSKVVDMSAFDFSRTKEDMFKTNEEMMNLNLLNKHLDSMRNVLKLDAKELKRNNSHFLQIEKSDTSLQTLVQNINKTDTIKSKFSYTGNLINAFDDSTKSSILPKVLNDIQSLQRYATIQRTNGEINIKKIRDFDIERQRKFTMAFACMLLFLIGAPMGAIVRKGGLGMPAVIAISFFVVYFVLATLGEKLAKEGTVSPMFGMWLSTIALLPIALLVMYQARNDSSIFRKEAYVKFFSKIKSKYTKKYRSPKTI